MVISVQPLAGGAGAAAYYLRREAGCEHEHEAGLGYYLNEHDAAGRWLGKGAAALGLSGSLLPEQEALLRELLEGRFAGEQLARPVWRTAPDGTRVDMRCSGFDVTMSAPKSVSVLMGLAEPTVGERQLVGGDGGVFAVADDFASYGHHFEARGLQGDGQEIFHPVEVRVLFVDDHEHLLRQIVGRIPS